MYWKVPRFEVGGYKTEIHMLPLNEMIAMDIRWDKTVQAWSCKI
jgi:hypothetical protein